MAREEASWARKVHGVAAAPGLRKTRTRFNTFKNRFPWKLDATKN